MQEQQSDLPAFYATTSQIGRLKTYLAQNYAKNQYMKGGVVDPNLFLGKKHKQEIFAMMKKANVNLQRKKDVQTFVMRYLLELYQKEQKMKMDNLQTNIEQQSKFAQDQLVKIQHIPPEQKQEIKTKLKELTQNQKQSIQQMKKANWVYIGSSNVLEDPNTTQEQKRLARIQQAKAAKEMKQINQQYAATYEQKIALMASISSNQQYVKALQEKVQDNMLNNKKFQDFLPFSIDPLHTIIKLRQLRAKAKQKNLYDMQYPKKAKFSSISTTDRIRGKAWDQLHMQNQLTLLPKTAPHFVRKYMLDKTAQHKLNAEQQLVFSNLLQDDIKNSKLKLADLLVNRKYWTTRDPPPGFQWDQDRESIVMKSQNPNLQNLWPMGIGYKRVPTVAQISKQQQFLINSHKTAKQTKDAYDQDVKNMIIGAQMLGFNPHFGAISKNSPSLYIGAFVDPFTGSIRLPPKPKLNDFNPVSRQSMMQYKVLRAMYTWNSNVSALEQMKKFMQQTDRGWKRQLKNKIRHGNVLQKKRNQLKQMVRKIALKQPIWGIQPDQNQYVGLANVVQNKKSTVQQIQKAIEVFSQQAQQIYTRQARQNMRRFPQQPAPIGQMMRAKAAYNWKDRPFINVQKYISRSSIVPTKLGSTGLKIAQRTAVDSLISQQTQQNIQNLRKRIEKKGYQGAYNTLSQLRNSKGYDQFNIVPEMVRQLNPEWNEVLYDEQQDYKKAQRNLKFLGRRSLDQIKQRDVQFPFLTKKLNNQLSQQQARKIEQIKQVISIAQSNLDDNPYLLPQIQELTSQKLMNLLFIVAQDVSKRNDNQLKNFQQRYLRNSKVRQKFDEIMRGYLKDQRQPKVVFQVIVDALPQILQKVLIGEQQQRPKRDIKRKNYYNPLFQDTEQDLLQQAQRQERKKIRIQKAKMARQFRKGIQARKKTKRDRQEQNQQRGMQQQE